MCRVRVPIPLIGGLYSCTRSACVGMRIVVLAGPWGRASSQLVGERCYCSAGSIRSRSICPAASRSCSRTNSLVERPSNSAATPTCLLSSESTRMWSRGSSSSGIVSVLQVLRLNLCGDSITSHANGPTLICVARQHSDMGKQLSVRIDDDLEEMIEEEIESHPYEPSESDVVRTAIREYLSGNANSPRAVRVD